MPNPITNRKLRIAIVGCGRIAKNHFGAIEQHAEDLELVGVCDSNPAVLKQYTDSHQVPGYAHLPELLTREQPDLVAPCTPPATLRSKTPACSTSAGVTAPSAR